MATRTLLRKSYKWDSHPTWGSSRATPNLLAPATIAGHHGSGRGSSLGMAKMFQYETGGLYGDKPMWHTPWQTDFGTLNQGGTSHVPTFLGCFQGLSEDFFFCWGNCLSRANHARPSRPQAVCWVPFESKYWLPTIVRQSLGGTAKCRSCVNYMVLTIRIIHKVSIR